MRNAAIAGTGSQPLQVFGGQSCPWYSNRDAAAANPGRTPQIHGQPLRTVPEPLNKVLTTQIEVPSRFSPRRSLELCMVSYEGHNFFIQGGLVGSRNRNMSGMLELESPRCLNLTAEFKLKKNRVEN